MSAAAAPSLLEYATPAGRDPWRPILFKPCLRSLVLVLLTAGSITWLALRHQPWRLVATIPSDYHLKPLFTADNRILTFDTRFGVNLVDPATGVTIRNVLPKIDTGTYRYFVLKNGEQILALPHIDRTALLYDVSSGRVIDRLPNPDGLGSLLVAVAPDVPRVISTTQNRTNVAFPYAYSNMRLWDLTQKPRPEPQDLHMLGDALWFSPDGRRLLLRDRANSIGYRLVDTDTLNAVARFHFFPTGNWVSEGFTGKYCWAVATDPKRPMELRVFNASAGQQVHAADLVGLTNINLSYGSALSDDAALIATVAYVGPTFTLWLHDAATGQLVSSRNTRFSSPVAWFTNSHRILASDRDKGQLAIIDPAHNQPLAILPSPPLDQVLPSPTISADGQSIVSSADPQATTLAIFRPAGWDCPESPHGALAFPQTWLTVSLFAFLTLSLAADARRSRTGAVTRPPPAPLTTLLVLVTFPLTLYFTVEACLNHLTLSPAPLLLLATIGLMTHSRFWRLATLVLLSGLFPLLIYSAHRVIQLGLKDNARIQILERFHDVPHLILLLALCGLTVLTAWAIYLLARPRPA